MKVVVLDVITNESNTFRKVIYVRYDKDLKGVYLTQLSDVGSITTYYMEDCIILEVIK